ncbi:MAG: helix-turn-helix domain-containing protein [Bradyrhizobium sp.]|nr:helix-turn-helix domain-containing protein [Bradyrhizobium sp.]
MQVTSVRRSNPERTAEMRARLVATARRLFVTHGYAATSTPSIVEAAGVTRGALYHHFADKQAIFRAVVEAESEAVAAAIAAADTPGLSARARLLAGAKAYVLAMQAQGRTRLLLIEGRNGDASLKTGLEEAIAEGTLPRLPIEALTSLLSAMFERAAIDVAEGEPMDNVLAVIAQVLRGLATSEQKA